MPLTRAEIKRLFLTRAEQAGLASAEAWNKMRYETNSNNLVNLGLNTVTSAISGYAAGGPIGAAIGASKGASDSISRADQYGNLPTYDPGRSAEQGLSGNAYFEAAKMFKNQLGGGNTQQQPALQTTYPVEGVPLRSAQNTQLEPTPFEYSSLNYAPPTAQEDKRSTIDGAIGSPLTAFIPMGESKGQVAMLPNTGVYGKEDPYNMAKKTALLSGMITGNPLKGMMDYADIQLKQNDAELKSEKNSSELEIKTKALELKQKQMDLKAMMDAQELANEHGEYTVTLPSGDTKTFKRSESYTNQLKRKELETDSKLIASGQKIANALGTFTVELTDGSTQQLNREPSYVSNLSKDATAIKVMNARYSLYQKQIKNSLPGTKLSANQFYNLVKTEMMNSIEPLTLEMAADRVLASVQAKTPEVLGETLTSTKQQVSTKTPSSLDKVYNGNAYKKTGKVIKSGGRLYNEYILNGVRYADYNGKMVKVK